MENSKDVFKTIQYNSYDLLQEMGKQKFPDEFLPINSIFDEDCDGHLEAVYTQAGRLFIRGSIDNGEKENELLLRYGNNSLTVARVSFIHRRCGNMTRLYRALQKIRKKYELAPIVIESAITDGSIAWCEKNGFQKKLHNYIEAVERLSLSEEK